MQFSSWGRIVVLGVLGSLASFACGQSDRPTRGNASAGGEAGGGGTGGDTGGGTGGDAGGGGTGGSAGGGGTAGAGTSGEGGQAGGAGCSNSEVTPNAWYPIGDSAPDWPERGSASSSLALRRRTIPAISYDLLTPRLAVHEGGLAAVAAGCEVYVFESGTWQWQTPAEAYVVGGAVDGCKVSIDRDGQLFFIYWSGDAGDDYDGYAARWTASGWELVPGAFATPARQEWGPDTSITFDAQNVLHLGWDEWPEIEEIGKVQAARFDATMDLWLPIGPSPILSSDPANLGGFYEPELSHGPNGELALLTGNYYDGAIVLEWNGDEWLDRSEDILNVEGRLHLVHDDRGAPVVYVASAEELLLFRWTGAQWMALEPNESNLATLPERVRFDAWTEDDQVYVRRFGPCGWTGLSGSAEGGGVSNAPIGTAVSDPGLAVMDGRVCVAWTEDDTDPVVLIRCHDLPSD